MTSGTESINGTAAAALADVLVGHGVERVFTVPGESFLPLLEALRQRDVTVITCRHEGGAAFMAQAQGRLTGRPGVCLVSRAPGATNGSIGIHEAEQAGTPMIMIVGQVTRSLLGLGAFQEVDLATVFAGLAKDAVQELRAESLAATAERVWETTMTGRPGPVVLSVPTDVLRESVVVEHSAALSVPPRHDHQLGAQADLVCSVLAGASRPVVIVGGGTWSATTAESLRRWAEASNLPVVADFRCQDYVDNRSPVYVGDLGNAPSLQLRSAVQEADVVLCLGSELGDMMTQGYTLFAERRPGQQIVQVVAEPRRIRNRVADIVIGADVPALVEELAQRRGGGSSADWVGGLREQWEQWTSPPALDDASSPDLLAACISGMSDRSTDDTVVTVGAGNYTAWVQRFWRFRQYGTQVAPRSGSMGYGVPAAISAALTVPERPVVAFAGDGCFMMTSQELATAARYGLGIVNVVVNNGVYGTIRMHQERHYPSRVVGTDLTNPDFVQYAESFGCWATRARTLDEVLVAYEDCVAHAGRLSLIEIVTEPEVISPTARIGKGGGLTNPATTPA